MWKASVQLQNQEIQRFKDSVEEEALILRYETHLGKPMYRPSHRTEPKLLRFQTCREVKYSTLCHFRPLWADVRPVGIKMGARVNWTQFLNVLTHVKLGRCPMCLYDQKLSSSHSLSRSLQYLRCLTCTAQRIQKSQHVLVLDFSTSPKVQNFDSVLRFGFYITYRHKFFNSVSGYVWES